MAASLAQPPHKTWTRAEVTVLEAAGLLAGTRFELIDGEIFDKMGQNPRHATAVCRLAALLTGLFNAKNLRIQLPVEPSESEANRNMPEPDVVVTRDTEAAYRSRHPGPKDVVLVAEVADSTYDYDARRKARLYARAGFPEYIVLDLNERELLVFQTPADGIYKKIQVLRSGDYFCPAALSGTGLAFSDLLPDE